MNMVRQMVARSDRTRSNFGSKARRAKNLLNDKKLLARAHSELCMSTQALFVAAYDDDEDAARQYKTWQAQFQAVVRNKVVTDRDEQDKIASSLLPLQVRAYILVRLAA